MGRVGGAFAFPAASVSPPAPRDSARDVRAPCAPLGSFNRTTIVGLKPGALPPNRPTPAPLRLATGTIPTLAPGQFCTSRGACPEGDLLHSRQTKKNTYADYMLKNSIHIPVARARARARVREVPRGRARARRAETRPQIGHVYIRLIAYLTLRELCYILHIYI